MEACKGAAEQCGRSSSGVCVVLRKERGADRSEGGGDRCRADTNQQQGPLETVAKATPEVLPRDNVTGDMMNETGGEVYLYY